MLIIRRDKGINFQGITRHL